MTHPNQTYHFFTVDVFTQEIFGGNPLAVFPEAQGLGPQHMQQIARELNLSETTFVLPPAASAGTHRVRIFTPETELPFAGHPTLGTAYILAATGRISLTADVTNLIFEEDIGPIPVTVCSTNGQPTFTQFSVAQLPTFGPEPPPLDDLASLLSLTLQDLTVVGWEPQAASCGVPFLFIPIRDRKALAKAQLDFTHWSTSLVSYWAPHLYLFTVDAQLDSSDFRTRMFAPAMGIQEDPATGAAASAFAGYLSQKNTTPSGTFHWRLEQGFEMGRPSLLEVEADKQNNHITAIRVGGHSVQVSQGEIYIPGLNGI